MKIDLHLENVTLPATLLDNPTARAFAAILPLTMELEDYASTEKIAYLPKKLTTEGAPRGYEPKAGDLTYYAPWGNLAIFYKDAPFATGLIHLGRVQGDIEALRRSGKVKIIGR